jgi:hypothetical protein
MHNEISTSTSTFVHKANASTEYEFTVVSHNTSANTVYFFRLFDVVASSAVPLDTGESYPSLAVEGGSLTFSITGLSQNTSTGGITTNIDTTATDVPFGQLPYDTSVTGAQRLDVSTDANSGFEVYGYQSQDLTGGEGQTIQPFSGSNTSPASWTSGCTIATPGCFGYHTSESVLAGGSTRFAADDTYAAFTQDPAEVAYSADPTPSHSTDIVYRIEAMSSQAVGNYTTNLTYIVVPVF